MRTSARRMRIGCMTAAAVVVAALESGCNAPAGTRYAEDMCSGTTYSGCVAGVAAAVGAGWKLFAICEYANGEGDVVQLDTAGEADDRCSAGGTIAPSTVFAVVNR